MEDTDITDRFILLTEEAHCIESMLAMDFIYSSVWSYLSPSTKTTITTVYDTAVIIGKSSRRIKDMSKIEEFNTNVIKFITDITPLLAKIKSVRMIMIN